ncbi:MAG: hypothetical protein JJE09_06010 [Bacteroidia bacterium]|nr:hypothetical protein [Bacteroidia bacterium]
MDPVSIIPIIASTWSLIAPYVKKVGGKVAEKATESLPDITGKIWDLIKNKLESQQETQSLPDDLVKNPEEQMVQGAFQYQLKKLLENDEAFAKQLESLIKEAKRDTTTAATLHGSGAIAQGQGARAIGEGGISIEGDVSGGNITIGNKNRITNNLARKSVKKNTKR